MGPGTPANPTSGCYSSQVETTGKVKARSTPSLSPTPFQVTPGIAPVPMPGSADASGRRPRQGLVPTDLSGRCELPPSHLQHSGRHAAWSEHDPHRPKQDPTREGNPRPRRDWGGDETALTMWGPLQPSNVIATIPAVPHIMPTVLEHTLRPRRGHSHFCFC